MSRNILGDMSDVAARPLRGLTYTQARRLVIAAGVLVLGAVALVMSLRHVESAEVVAVLLFLPVFLALLQWNEVGGLVAGAAAAGVYIAMRQSAIHAVGASHFYGLVGSRTVGFIAFGLVGGWANRQLKTSLVKLDLYDQIDDATGLFNARFFLQDTDLEMARSLRYQTFFAVVTVDVPAGVLDAVGRRSRARVLREAGRLLRDSVRTVDRVSYGADARVHHFSVILPETGPDGARVFAERLAGWVGEFLTGHGVSVDDAVTGQAITFPEEREALDALRAEFTRIDHAAHAEAAVTEA